MKQTIRISVEISEIENRKNNKSKLKVGSMKNSTDLINL